MFLDMLFLNVDKKKEKKKTRSLSIVQCNLNRICFMNVQTADFFSGERKSLTWKQL